MRPIPQVSVQHSDGQSIFTVAREYAIKADKVQLIYSRDNAYTFDRVQMKRRLDGCYSVRLEGDTTNLVYFVEVRWPGPIYLTSIPEMPEGFVPRIRPPS